MEIEGRAPTAVDAALSEFREAAHRLVEVVEGAGLDALRDLELVAFLQDFERVRNQLALVDHRAVRDLVERRVPEKVTQPGTAGVLTWALRISEHEARRRVRASEALGERVSMLGEALAPVRPAMSAAQRAGEMTPEQVDIGVRALARVDHRGFDPADLDHGDELIAAFARTFAPKELRNLAGQVVERIDPDGTVPAEEVNADRRHFALRKTRDGMYACEGRFTGEVGAKLTAVLGPLAAPRVEKVTLDDGREVTQEDPRHHGQRMHDAVEEVCDRLLRSGTLPDSGGTPATVIITIREDDLQARRRWGMTSDGTLLSAATVIGLADEAEVYPTVVSALGVVLELGRTRRLASCGQTVALIARDGGCSFPGCSRPPEWCERHHILEWMHGGKTDLANLTLLCAYHHHNFAGRGWTCLMIDGLPAWVPPRWMDPERRPVFHERLRAREAEGLIRC